MYRNELAKKRKNIQIKRVYFNETYVLLTKGDAYIYLVVDQLFAEGKEPLEIAKKFLDDAKSM